MSIYYYEEPLQNIISKLKLDIIYKNIKINLMDHLQYLKLGYLFSGDEINMLFKIYSILNADDNLLERYSINISCISRVHDKDINKIIKISREADILKSLKHIITGNPKIHIFNTYEILNICINDKISDNLLNMITKNDHMKLIYNINKGNLNIIKSILDKNKACPFIGYSIARLKNNEINDYIKSICIKRILLIKYSLINTNTDIIGIILDYLNELMK